MSTDRKPLVLTTGGAGFIGSHTIVELLEAGYDTVILDSFCNARKGCIANLEKIVGQSLKVREIDLLDKDALTNLFHEFKFDFVIHFAALKAVGESVHFPLQYYQNNITGFVNLLEVMVLKSTFKINLIRTVMSANDVKKLVYSSSCTVYGDPSKLPLTEDTPIGNCANPYGRTKYIGEMILEDLAKSDPEWSIINLRYFNPVGAHKSGLIGEDAGPAPKNIFPCLTKTAYGLMKEVVVFGNDYKTPDGTGIRDYIHVVDLSKGHVSAMKHLTTFKGCKAYNLGTGQGYSVLELIKAMEKASGRHIQFRYDARRGGDIAVAFADTTLAEKELGWKAEKALPEMCEDAWRWQCNFPEGYPKVD
ncbi:unnamed protein product [Rodentolepis nana]|uniref:UDP-glucose 4-epimerase n=1 Tax=Rodentolepis nana TaxID=102285 RepID=A0A0R3T4D1_RODNA|nr:unnamed protein product [Rodentolepis nana]